jgi:hypothetical protein
MLPGWVRARTGLPRRARIAYLRFQRLMAL